MHTPRKSFDFYSAKSPNSKGASPTLDDSGRFIPNRSISDFDCLFKTESTSSPSRTFSNLVHFELFGSSNSSKLLRYSPSPKPDKENVSTVPRFEIQAPLPPTKRELPRVPYKMLDAPQLRDDFYTDLVDWSIDDVVAVGLEENLYLWNAKSSRITELRSNNNSPFTSVAWNTSGSHLAVGSCEGQLQIYDSTRQALVFQQNFKDGRINCLDWNQSLVSAGTNEGIIIHFDIRSCSAAAKLNAHEQEVCGLKWAPDGRKLASGGNDNKLVVWSALQDVPMGFLTGHVAAVKALGWDPMQNEILASGGGNSDKKLKLWNTLTLEEVASVDTQSQVCKLMFSKNTRELVSTHGYSTNSVMLWGLPGLNHVGTLKGHKNRVMHMALAPDGENIVTGSGDETLRFWNLFPKKQAVIELVSLFEPSFAHLR